MIPQLVTARWRRKDGRTGRLFLPVVPIVIVLSPLLVLAVIGGIIACLMFDMPPFRTLAGVGRLFWALPGARFDIEQGRTAVSVSIR
ncbi:hypothetical protein GCM10009853_091930 [Glycomyces scopariae]|uniref:Uncharacterized protein n=1 Tax=Glycomyces sambucus TaxID=380244 RepID=A0A1G9FFX1_9ACTN|nr:hypothetical protein [Glycomyces sambucus]SDK87280.1 hypothetical protein SAMN05216298_1765 [Glycomyces sambucus]